MDERVDDLYELVGCVLLDEVVGTRCRSAVEECADGSLVDALTEVEPLLHERVGTFADR